LTCGRNKRKAKLLQTVEQQTTRNTPDLISHITYKRKKAIASQPERKNKKQKIKKTKQTLLTH